jgi:hypothetical protein
LELQNSEEIVPIMPTMPNACKRKEETVKRESEQARQEESKHTMTIQSQTFIFVDTSFSSFK